MEFVEFTKFGITFKPLSDDNLEMVRIWRNSDDVRLFMQHQEIITIEQHQTWFQQLDKSTNYYFVGFQKEIPFGVYNIKDVDFNVGSGEPGVFLKSRDIWEADCSMRGSIVILKFAFEILKLNTLKSHVLKSNQKVLVYNQQMGFQINEMVNDVLSFELHLSKEDFYGNKKVIRLIKYLENN